MSTRARGRLSLLREWLGLLTLLLTLVVTGGACSPFGNTASLKTPTSGDVTVGPKLSPTPQNLPALLQAERLLTTAAHPPRDLYSLAQRLKLHDPQPPPQRGRSTPLNAHPGQEDQFWLLNLDTHRYERIRARLVYVTPHVYMYVEDGQSASLTALKSSADLFEERIYPGEHAIFGSEWQPGIDDDVHLTILNAASLGNGVGGYFSSADEYPTAINPYSNEREMIYIDLDTMLPGTADYNSTLAHEFQHMIHWHLHPNDPEWINEGMSLLAQHLNGFSVGGADRAFLSHPNTQLTDWSDDMPAALDHYGAAYLFLAYFAEHYGGYPILKELLSDPADPPLSFDHVLAHHGYKDRFDDVVNKWYLANVIQDDSIDKGDYGYATIQVGVPVPSQSVTGYPFTMLNSIHQYAAEYYTFEPAGQAGNLTLTFNGTPTTPIIANTPYHSHYEWWSNRYDNMDSTLTRSFDLSRLKGQHVTLQFAAWFDLERDYDYAFVEASTDGINWTTLPGRYTTASNPNGGNWGYGYTGTSGGSSPQWVEEQIDLTPYAGQRIQLRFEEVTDDAVNHQGFALAWIRIPELHFEDTLASDNGWVSHGFIRSANVLPEHYNVQALVYEGQDFSVRHFLVNLASGQASVTIPDFGRKVSRVTLVISAWAVATSLPVRYQLTARLGL
ncbi:immune inhibitor A domain-containing protein [Thermogemmatispora onikobensis]|uniref:immune inhibitor A domain-containing protein n=1 Tax=Thermogemmatispora onikobensis TaxID=732234 RepID=UPI0008533A15|nr:immune inhibitor A domain-containing protein [Thermogemmatispora onikobensis]